MPIRQDVQGDIQSPTLTGYQSPGAARAQFQGVDVNPNSQGGARFWEGLVDSAKKQGEVVLNKAKANAYLRGQQDSMLGKQRGEVHSFMQEEYEQGFNRAQIGTDLAKFQMGLQAKAVEYVNSGKTPEEWSAFVTEQTDGLLNSAGQHGMDLNSKDWQSWLGGVQSTRDTAGDLYQVKTLERAKYLKGQSIASEGAASISTVMAADETGNPMQALGNVSAHVSRVFNDDSLSPQEKDGILADYSGQLLASMKSSAAVEGVTSYFQALPEFQRLPTEVQTAVIARSQNAYNKTAADESGAVYEYVSQVRAVTDPATLEREFPMGSFIARLNEQQAKRRISPAQYYSMVDEENTRRLKLQQANMKVQALNNGTTLSDIASTTGDTLGKTKTAITETYAAKYGGYSGGGLALMQRGLKSGAQDITSVGIEMLQQDAQSLASIDARNLKRDADGLPTYPSTIVNSLTNLKQAYDASMRAGNNVQAQQLISGLPDAVAYGIRQAGDANSIADVVYRRADDLAAGRIMALPAAMPKEMLASSDDVSAGLFDTSLTQKGAARNILGVQSWVFTSKEDARTQESRLAQVNGAIGEEYTSLYNQGKLPALAGDDLKNWLVGRVAARTVRVDDGTDAGTLMILPNVANKEALFGSTDNNLIGAGLKEQVQEFRTRNPGAKTVQMRYDNMSSELVLSATDKDNVLLTTSESISARTVQQAVRAAEARITSGGQGKTQGSLAVPGAGFVQFNPANNYGIQPQVYTQAVNQLVSYEGYTDTKGFSILSTHPTTGAKLNEDKYVKQPEDSPQIAAIKLQSYLGDKVVPQVMSSMGQFSDMPEYLRQRVFSQLVETTYHAGNAAAFADIVKMAANGQTKEAYDAFRDSPLFKDAGKDSRRNKDRMATLDAVSQFSLYKRTGNDYLRPPYQDAQ